MKNFLLLFLWIVSYPLLALDTLVVSDKKIDYMPKGFMYEMMEDRSGSLLPSELLSDSVQKLFRSLPSPTDFTNKNNKSPYWFRVALKMGNGNKFWLMELVDPHIQYIDVYELKNGKLESVSSPSGYEYSFYTKDFFYKNYLYNLDLSDGKSHLYYVRVKSAIYNSFVIKIRAPEYLVSYSLVEYFLLGLYYGILLIMAVYNLFIFFSVKESTYVFYVLYVIACGFNSMNEDGLGFQFLWPDAPWFNYVSIRVVPLFLMLAFTFYSTSFLDLKKREPLLYKITYLLLGFYFLIFSVNGLFFNFRWNTQALYLLPFGFIYLLAIRSVSRGYNPAKYFLLGYSFILFSIVIFYLRTTGIEVINHFFYVYSFNYGFILEVVILSYALSERLKEGKKEKENAQKRMIEQLKENERYKDQLNRELEEKVEERTSELTLANEEINRMNKFLEQHNLKLQADVKHISKERIMQREVSFDEFKMTYPNEEACFQFLSDLKWAQEYQCRKCGNERYSVMNNLARRCNKCKYIESSTAFTIFHSLKFSILDAFYMLFLVNTRKNITAEELSKTINLSEKSCASFKRKMLAAEKSLKGKSRDKSGWERLIPYYEEE